jgi:predicted ArsR family transcriptional regulator
MGEAGRPRRVSDEDILAVVRDSDGPAVNTGEVAEQLPLTRRCVHARLTDLAEEGTLETKTMGKRVRIWWIAE